MGTTLRLPHETPFQFTASELQAQVNQLSALDAFNCHQSVRDTQQEGMPVEKEPFTRMKIDGEDDRRVENNVVLHEYRILSDQEKATMKQIKDMGLEMIEYLDLIGEGREISIAKTRIEEAVMWAAKHVTK